MHSETESDYSRQEVRAKNVRASRNWPANTFTRIAALALAAVAAGVEDCTANLWTPCLVHRSTISTTPRAAEQ